MGLKLNNIAATISLLLSLTFTANAQSHVFDVRSYGAKANADITQALTNAWKAACASPGHSKVLVPVGTYGLGAVKLLGPCKDRIELQVEGTLQAPEDPRVFKSNFWVAFERIDWLTLSGSGTFNGKGKNVWGKKQCSEIRYCGNLPINIRFDYITNSIIRDITSLDSKQFHINVLGGKNVTFQHVTIKAPENSANTDGIHIGRSNGINILNSNIGTGDDCISLGDGSQNILVQGVTCGPGHGISLGSLGKYQGEEPVTGVRVIGCTLTNTQAGLRIKTWPNSFTGTASDIHFENIIVNNVANPVLIDQLYCPWNKCNAKIPSKVQISNVFFNNIRGTSITKAAVKLVCSSAVPCRNVQIRDINIAYHGSNGPATSQCTNVRPIISGKQNPPACTIK